MATLIPREIDFAETAPVIAESIGVVDGTPQEVWDAICDYARWPEWFTQLTRCEATSEPATGVGSTREVDLPGGVTVKERFIAWDEPECWAFTAVEAPPVFESLVERITIKSLGPRLTEVTYRMAIGPRKGLTPLVKVARRSIEKNLRVALRNLNAVVVDRRGDPTVS